MSMSKKKEKFDKEHIDKFFYEDGDIVIKKKKSYTERAKVIKEKAKQI